MRILITGGFGFIGGRLAAYLSQAGHQVLLGSRNDSTHPPDLVATGRSGTRSKWGDECPRLRAVARAWM